MQLALAKFADACVVSSIRERFIHEALKRPSKLHERICHHTAELLEPRFCGGSTTFNPEEQCLILRDVTGFKEIAWKEIERSVEGFGGILVISLSRSRFYCESESSPRRQVWAGAF